MDSHGAAWASEEDDGADARSETAQRNGESRDKLADAKDAPTDGVPSICTVGDEPSSSAVKVVMAIN